MDSTSATGDPSLLPHDQLIFEEVWTRVRRLLWLLFWVSAITVASMVAFIAWVVITEPCAYDIVGEFPSPHNEQRVAVVIVGNCHATTPFVTHVGIRYPGSEFDLHRDHFFAVRGRNNIVAEWDDYGNLTVFYDAADEIYTQKTIWRRRPIRYRERPAMAE